MDNVFLGALVNNQTDFPGSPGEVNPYHSFGLLMPELDSAKLSTKGIYIFSPEHQFFNKKLVFDHIKVHGKYVRNSKFVPYPRTVIGDEKIVYNGVYINDVQAGTSYNAEAHTSEDNDGFDLQILYRSNNQVYSYDTSKSIDDPLEILYLSAAAYRQIDGKIFYNTSTDNKIMIARYNNIDAGDLFNSSGTP